MNIELVIFRGAPCTGKTSITDYLCKDGKFIGIHIDSLIEALAMEKDSFEAKSIFVFDLIKPMISALCNKFDKPIIIDYVFDRLDTDFINFVKSRKYIIIKFTCSDDIFLKKLIRKRKIGYKNVRKIMSFNKKITDDKNDKNEFSIDINNKSPKQISDEILKVLRDINV